MLLSLNRHGTMDIYHHNIMRSFIFTAGLALLCAGAARADFTPIELTPESFTHDLVVERTAPAPAGRNTRASMDAGTNNTGNSWYEVGYNVSAPATGLPAAGSTFTHQTFADHSYTMPASYSAPNGLLIQSNQVTSGTITIVAPAPYANLSFLASGGNGGITVNYTIYHADNSTQAGTLVIGDWFNGANPAYTTAGRVNVATFAFANVNETNPRIYGYDVPVANTASAVTRIEITFASGTGRAAILALSAMGPADIVWAPVAITGYNYDMVVEATAPQPGALTTATTASMDGGTANTGNTWFEQGYDPFFPEVGLPPAGSTIISLSLPDHTYMLPATYTGPNAAFVDQARPEVNLTPATPALYTGLSFLSATANGTVTNQCIMQYADGTSETNTFLSRDWFNNTPFAFVARGRVNLNNRSFNNIGANNPRLYEAQFFLNSASPLTNVVLRWIGGAATSRAVVFAVSGTTGPVAPIISSQPQGAGVFPGANIQLSATVSGTPPFTYQWQKGENGVFANISDSGNVAGATTSTLFITSITPANGGDYRLIIANAAATATSAVATVTVLSTLADVTAPGDVITAVGGTSPANETVDHSIDNVMQKYLNYGSGPNPQGAPFVGPVGFVVTPAAGATLVTGLRFYTANDGVERDPTDYILEGSSDGINYALISSNSLALPDGRNTTATAPVDPTTQFLQQVLFANQAAYKSYRLTFTNVKNAAAANSCQIGEVELLGVGAPTLTYTLDFGSIVLSSSVPAILQASPALSGPAAVWEDIGPIDNSANIHTIEPGTTGNRFFRARVTTP
jgi:hypothetical protein